MQVSKNGKLSTEEFKQLCKDYGVDDAVLQFYLDVFAPPPLNTPEGEACQKRWIGYMQKVFPSSEESQACIERFEIKLFSPEDAYKVEN